MPKANDLEGRQDMGVSTVAKPVCLSPIEARLSKALSEMKRDRSNLQTKPGLNMSAGKTRETTRAR